MTTPDVYQLISTNVLVASPTNPRKTFNEGKLQELAESIKAIGVMQPIIVRVLPGERLQETFQRVDRHTPLPTHEIVAGERRWRASIIAKASTIPCIVRELNDDQVLEIQVIENLQRDDLTALEEAEGYKVLMEHNHLSADELGAKIGKSRSYIYNRLRLLDLAPDGAAALREGRIDNSKALVICRIPNTEMQARALEFATKPDAMTKELPSLRFLTEWVKLRLMRKLQEASFPTDNTELNNCAGACYQCHKRTGAAPDLFADIKSPDLCTDPDCYTAKEGEWLGIMIEKANVKNMEFIASDDRSVFNHKGELVGYTDVRELVTLPNGEEVTISQALDGKLPHPAMAENPRTKKVVEVVPTDELTALLIKMGIRSAAMAPAGKPDPKRLQIEIGHIKSRAEVRIENLEQKLLIEQALASIDSLQQGEIIDGLCHPLVEKAQAIYLLGQLSRSELYTATGETKEFSQHAEPRSSGKIIVDFLAQAGQYETDRAMLKALVLLSEDSLPITGCNPAYPTTVGQAYLSSKGIDCSKFKKEATETIRAEVEAEIAAVTQLLNPPKLKTEQNPPTPQAPLAPANPAGSSSTTKKRSPAAAGKTRASAKPKTSEQEALSGIAAAMQGIEASPDLQTGEGQSDLQAPSEGAQHTPAPDAPHDQGEL